MGVIIFNPGLRLLGPSFEGYFVLLFLIVVVFLCFLACVPACLRGRNRTVDNQIMTLCVRTSTPNATFTLQTLWTQNCKPKGARTYRALCIAPAAGVVPGAVTAVPVMGTPVPVASQAVVNMGVTCPPGCKSGDAVQITTPSGQPMLVSVPQGVGPGQQFIVQAPNGPPPPVVQAVATTTTTTSHSTVMAQAMPMA